MAFTVFSGYSHGLKVQILLEAALQNSDDPQRGCNSRRSRYDTAEVFKCRLQNSRYCWLSCAAGAGCSRKARPQVVLLRPEVRVRADKPLRPGPPLHRQARLRLREAPPLRRQGTQTPRPRRVLLPTGSTTPNGTTPGTTTPNNPTPGTTTPNSSGSTPPGTTTPNSSTPGTTTPGSTTPKNPGQPPNPSSNTPPPPPPPQPQR